MSAIATPARRSPAIASAVFGMMLGIVLGAGITFLAFGVAGRTPTTQGESTAIVGTAAFDALRQQHLAREYSAAGVALGAEAAATLRQRHLAREYGTAASLGSWADQLFEHTMRENGR